MKSITDFLSKNSDKKDRSKAHIAAVSYVFMILFISMGAYFVHFVKVDSEEFIYNDYNSRFSTFADTVIRGDILSADGKVIATTKVDKDGQEVREYPYKELFAHTVGYVTNGSAGLEAKYSLELLKSNINGDVKLKNNIDGVKNPGDNLYTTLDYKTQVAAREALGFYRGAVVAMEPETGKIIAMVSKPDFDPATLNEYWEFVADKDNNSSVLLNRATNGMYPPGSTFKIITALSFMRQDENYNDFYYDCKGTVKLNDFTMHCAGKSAHGGEDLTKAFYKSCNCAFSTIGNSFDLTEYKDTVEGLFFNTELPTQLDSVKSSKFALKETATAEIIGQTSIGQGDTLVSPLHMCMIASAIANDGEMMKPSLVDRIVSADGYPISTFQPQSAGKVMTEKETEALSAMMEKVMENGSVAEIDFGNLSVYGKTGSAQFTDDESLTHSWFVGYAVNDEGKKLAIAVIMEEAGSGSKFATPGAAQVFHAYFD